MKSLQNIVSSRVWQKRYINNNLDCIDYFKLRGFCFLKCYNTKRHLPTSDLFIDSDDTNKFVFKLKHVIWLVIWMIVLNDKNHHFNLLNYFVVNEIFMFNLLLMTNNRVAIRSNSSSRVADLEYFDPTQLIYVLRLAGWRVIDSWNGNINPYTNRIPRLIIQVRKSVSSFMSMVRVSVSVLS